MIARYFLWLSGIADKINQRLFWKTWREINDYYCYKCWIVEALVLVVWGILPWILLLYIVIKLLWG